ncbi:MAG: tyrosine-type recombinase/integrase [Planctomycetota bacterium]|nr:tyrosine-type recombinase/integrase [Planctomycetota bacterium]
MALRTPGTGAVYRRFHMKNGKRVPYPRWSYYYIDAQGRRHDKTGYTDKAATEEKLREVLRRVARQKVGLAVPNEEDLHVPLKQHLEAFLVDKEADGITATHIQLLRTRITVMLDGTKAEVFADLTESSVKQFLLHGTKAKGWSKKTRNEYTAVTKQFCAWLCRRFKWTDPLQGLSRLKGQDDIRVRRFALTETQLGALLNAARERGVQNYLACHATAKPATFERLRLQGQERELAYRLGSMLGLRFNEIKTLSWGCLNLDASPPTCALRPENTKARRQDLVPIVFDELVQALRQWKALCTKQLGRAPSDAERVVHVPRHLPGDQFSKDCVYANIARENERGEKLDFYAATRHTYCTMLGRLRLSPHRLQRLMRHTDLKTTSKYLHLELEDMVIEPGLLPTINPQPPTPEIANLMPTQTRVLEQVEATPRTPDASLKDLEQAMTEALSGAGVQDNATPEHAERELAVALRVVESWWRRRESKAFTNT